MNSDKVQGGPDLNTFKEMLRHLTPCWLTMCLIYLACQADDPEFRSYDLSAHGVPVIIYAPDSALIQPKDYGVMRDITVKAGPGFDLQIFEFANSNTDAAGEKLHQLRSAQEDPFFDEVVQEGEHGFIYSKDIDSTLVDYDFRYVKMIDDREIIFQTGLIGTFTLEDVKRMYRAAKKTKPAAPEADQ